MKTPTEDPTLESRQSLWRLVISPTIWAAHFLLCYLTAAIWCAKMSGDAESFRTVRWAIAGFTVVALVGIAINGAGGWRRHRWGNEPLPHDFDSPADRHRFLGFATVLLSGLSAIATVFAALVAIFMEDCR